MAYEAKLFFDEGGFELITIRQAHYTDVGVKSSFVGGVASNTFITEGVAASAAAHTSLVGPFALMTSGLTLALATDSEAETVTTFLGTAGTRTDTTTYPHADLTGNFVLRIDGGVNQTITLGALTTAAQVIDAINAQAIGCHAEASTTQVKIISDSKGTGSSVGYTDGTSAIRFAAAVAGTGNVASLAAVTAAEVKTAVDLTALQIAVVTVNDNGSFTLTSPTTGVASTLNFGTGTANALFGFADETITGTAAGTTYNTIKVESGYRGTKNPGVYGNRLKVAVTQTPFHPSAVAGSELTVAIASTDDHLHLSSPRGLNAGSVLKITDGINTEYKIVAKVNTVVTNGVPSFVIELTGQMVNNYLVAATTVESCEFDLDIYLDGVLVESWDGLSTYDSAVNYFEAIVNDEATGSAYVYVTDLDAVCGDGADIPAAVLATALTGGTSEIAGLAYTDWVGSSVGKTGLFAMDELTEMLAFATVGTNDYRVFHSAALYAKNRMWFEYVGYCTLGASSSANVIYRETTLGVNSSYATLYAGGVKVIDPLGLSSTPKKSLSGVGALLGLRSRVDNLSAPNGGPWNAPAGEGDYGTLQTALDVVDVFTNEEHGLMNDAHINVMRKFTKTSLVTVWGARTLDASADQKFRYIPTRRQFQFFEKSIVDSTRWAVFRNNEQKTWTKLKNRVLSFLGTYLSAGAFPADKASDAYYVLCGVPDGTMDQADIDGGYTKAKVGMKPQKSAEFIEFQFSQYTGGSDLTE
jgi:hypothetical protein